MNHLVNFNNYSAEKIDQIIEKALRIKRNPSQFDSILKGKNMYMLFQKTSTRTALSFGQGISDLGGHYFMQNWTDSNFAVADICDEVRYLGRNVDIIMARLKENEDIQTMANFSSVPVVNGCCNKYHPCQALADMLTIKEKFGGYNINLLYIGVHNNVVNSLMETLPVLGGDLYLLTPIINAPSWDEEIVNVAKQTGRLHKIDSNISFEELKEVTKKMDVVYTDSWIDMEFFNNPSYKEEKERRISSMTQYQLNERLLHESNAIIMHDMPIHCGFEISRETVEKNIETILQQSENRRHAQNGALVTLLECDL